jgi:hypothetical protein
MAITTICNIKTDFKVAIPIFAFIAAAFWFYASWIGRGSFMNTPMAKFERNLMLQARCNAIAAAAAGIAALLNLTKSHSGKLWLQCGSWTIGCRGIFS